MGNGRDWPDRKREGRIVLVFYCGALLSDRDQTVSMRGDKKCIVHMNSPGSVGVEDNDPPMPDTSKRGCAALSCDRMTTIKIVAVEFALALPSSPRSKCCAIDEWLVWGSCTAASQWASKGRLGPEAADAALHTFRHQGRIAAISCNREFNGAYSRSGPPTGGHSALKWWGTALFH
jgi:hypothetical protein